MSSVMRGFAQPVTKNFVALTGLWPKVESVIMGCLTEGTYTNVGSLYIFNTVQDFADFLVTLTNLPDTGLNPEARQYQPMLNMGKKLTFGVRGGESNLLTMTKVNLSSVDNSVSRSHVAYVITENKLTDEIKDIDSDLNNSNLYVRVARV